MCEVGLAEQYPFGLAGGARCEERHAGRIGAGAMWHQRAREVDGMRGDSADIQRDEMPSQRVLAGVKQYARTCTVEHELMTLRRMIGP